MGNFVPKPPPTGVLSCERVKMGQVVTLLRQHIRGEIDQTAKTSLDLKHDVPMMSHDVPSLV